MIKHRAMIIRNQKKVFNDKYLPRLFQHLLLFSFQRPAIASEVSVNQKIGQKIQISSKLLPPQVFTSLNPSFSHPAPNRFGTRGQPVFSLFSANFMEVFGREIVFSLVQKSIEGNGQDEAIAFLDFWLILFG